ncbi:MAG TPA: dethiobiotin synthase [Kiritimatiellia bacterium]|nr:dethiobiotin synthase [Kiritimatiellia bacterium]
MLEHGVIVVGTDTGVGKTHVAAAMLLALRARGVDALPMKPVQTGAEHGRAPDLDFSLARAGIGFDTALYDLLAPYRLALPASPHLAARTAGTAIEPARILDAFRLLRARGHALVVEAAGGVLVPLTDALMQVDLLLEFNLPFVVVARPGLGTLNHTLLTLEALRKREARIAAIVLNGSNPVGDAIEEDNARTLARLNPGLPVHRFPRLPDAPPDALRAAGESLLAAMAR